jgi:quercetin dioxygenase-like cupin family protein
MITEQQQELASLYALGALPEGEARAFEAELRADAELRELVRGLQNVTDMLALGSTRVAPPAGLKDKVLSRIATPSSMSKTAAAGPPGFLFHGAGDARGWKELPIRGAWIKLLSLDSDRGYAVLMGRLEPGVRYPPHTHAGGEELYIVSGDLNIGDRRLGPGDFHHADAGTSHGENYSMEGCTLIAVLPAGHELVQFAMA